MLECGWERGNHLQNDLWQRKKIYVLEKRILSRSGASFLHASIFAKERSKECSHRSEFMCHFNNVVRRGCLEQWWRVLPRTFQGIVSQGAGIRNAGDYDTPCC
ncbi:hypothetical protein TNIN_247241 [Trichonephila inaurata madagascariensis]|uniref:Uncharacterized protein n=1 Tax=Trichonephila inaurata madagascariensis TaxID=2747483 RepID=A0A8X6YEW4_9ARAC|nr:hypothetical protein TNIN_247241 [Trichonephila inaurata madagascariensis]